MTLYDFVSNLRMSTNTILDIYNSDNTLIYSISDFDYDCACEDNEGYTKTIMIDLDIYQYSNFEIGTFEITHSGISIYLLD